MTNILIHPTTEAQWRGLLESQPHAILLSGEIGSGKKTLARNTASHILNHKDVGNHPYFLQILPEKQTIGIEAIRDLRGFLTRKTTGNSVIRRVVMIGDAQAMTTEAQNALLKSLEEPPADTIIIMTASDITLLKPTIISRLQHISVRPISIDHAIKMMPSHDEKALTSAYYMSRGRAGVLTALLEHKTDHPLVRAIDQAKVLLRQNRYDRMLLVDGLSKQKAEAQLLLEGLQCIVSSGLAQAAIKNNPELTIKFHLLSGHLYTATTNLKKMANPKLVLSELFLQM
ncbi:MAG TPA: AAA family ATPase [Candidatus Limnocylindrales bacterium]|nr:AAA family ATPase [Candidatus Limnocylindrales bacterium]